MPLSISESPYYGAGSITREQFLFYEMRTTARLMKEGLSDEEILKRIVEENLFQYPTEKTIKQTAGACIRRLHALNDPDLVDAIATLDRQQDYSFSRRDINVFFLQLQEQDDLVASWSEGTIKKIGSVLMRVLIDNEYIESGRSNKLQPVLLSHVLENAIRNNGEELALAAFNCF